MRIVSLLVCWIVVIVLTVADFGWQGLVCGLCFCMLSFVTLAVLREREDKNYQAFQENLFSDGPWRRTHGKD